MTNERPSESATGGQKNMKDERFDLIPIEPLTQLARHYGVGARKYDDNQWRKGYEFSKSYAALQRHLTQWWGGEDIDKETGSSHLAAAAWHCFTLMNFQQFNPEFDDRFNSPLNIPDVEPAIPVYPPMKWVYAAGPTGVIEPMGCEPLSNPEVGPRCGACRLGLPTHEPRDPLCIAYGEDA